MITDLFATCPSDDVSRSTRRSLMRRNTPRSSSMTLPTDTGKPRHAINILVIIKPRHSIKIHQYVIPEGPGCHHQRRRWRSWLPTSMTVKVLAANINDGEGPSAQLRLHDFTCCHFRCENRSVEDEWLGRTNGCLGALVVRHFWVDNLGLMPNNRLSNLMGFETRCHYD